MSKQITRVSAYMLIVEDERILMCRLSSQADEPGGWTIPGGGLEFGETPEAGAVREVREETGFDAEITELVGVNSRLVGAMHWVRIFYRGKVTGGALTPEAVGSTDLPAWLTRSDAAEKPLVELAEFGLRLAFDRNVAKKSG